MSVKTAIIQVRARQVLDSRGNPTVEAEVTSGRAMGRASVPSGASKGKHEALELRDAGEEFHGKGVTKAVANVNGVLRRGLLGLRVDDQRRLDQKMISLDGTPDKSRLGANAILAASMASARAAANSNGVSLFAQLRKSNRYILPVPMMNVINGGEHAGNNLAIQEFHIEPVGASSCTEAIRMGSEVYQSLKSILVSEHGKGAINVGDEGGFAPPFSLTRDALRSIRKAISVSGYGEKDVRLGIDAASSVFYSEKSGDYRLDGKTMSDASLEDYYAQLRDEFGLLTIEDPFHEEAFEAFASITKRLGDKTKVIGDDIYVTNVKRMRRGIEKKATNAVLIKLNQIGTVSETEDAIGLARKARWTTIVSHRSGDTEDPFIAHLATAYGADFIKTGAPARGERVAKYNELLRIEEELKPKARYAGKGLG
ncbi:MAG: phosphopyruvate hydratase [Nitrososphaerota archaeon]|jgi:enolase|nr:phosphopyruvate hydratase [Nitrososphaerota archaeon]MDG6903352.1 phosphopyruvate hydratase [Nitrososphaerota archaeon]MDG6911786.1 phosphopyruvate hydratase [Nitrososphaerota archaeon]MDG6940732.1 phosphopyruvate hydratase [Nitrososphaerota archaeon]MDG6945663.1 phosphopyruvate hydratase [Nitrososphaerota archaeon]